jgi:MFS family permease
VTKKWPAAAKTLGKLVSMRQRSALTGLTAGVRVDADAEVETAASLLAEFDSPHAWKVVAAAFWSMFVTYGIAYSFGAFFKPMLSELGGNLAGTSIVFSLTVFWWSILGPLTGHFSDRFGPRRIMIGGALLLGIGLIATAHVHRLWIAYFSYGLGVGVGVACSYVPAVAAVGGWFMRRRTLALGVAVAGIGCGTVCIPPLAAVMIGHLGWRETYEILGFGGAVLIALAGAIVEPPPIHPDASSFNLRALIMAPAFGWLYLSTVLVSLALFVPFVYLPDFAREHGIGRVAAAALISLIGGASVAGRLGLGALGDHVGVVRLYQASFLTLATSYVLWLLSGSYWMLVVFTLVMGTGYGGYVALGPAVAANIFGIRRLGALLGMLYTSSGLGALAGPPLAGMIIDHTGSYRGAIAFALGAAVLSFLALLPLTRLARARAT